jgi:hypothetical protein
MRNVLVGLATAVLALVVVTAVLAADPTKEKIARTKAGNREAAALVLKKGDVPAGWTGGSVKPDLSSSLGCSNYKPRQSDLVLIGAADTEWRKGTSTLASQTQVLRTPKMVRLDWKRTVADPRVLPCLRQAFAKQAKPAGEKLISLRWISVPKFGAFSKEYRLKMAFTSHVPATKFAVDALVFGSGRDEVSLIASGLASDEPSLHKLQLRLARRLAKRLHT